MRSSILLLSLMWLAACSGDRTSESPVQAGASSVAGPAFERAGKTVLPERKPEPLAGLERVYRLSPNVISGGEPEGQAGLESIAALGVKTVISVDGKAPDVEQAAALGLRYVHVPIQYRGITQDEQVRIAKTFRELEGPFYVHCFHGQHRGPAVAAMGRRILDNAPIDVALAEMRQWCGTSDQYEGLYAVIADDLLPTADVTQGFAWNFPARQPVDDIVEVMATCGRIHDSLKAFAKRGFATDPEHPDLDPQHEAHRLAELLQRLSDEAEGPAALKMAPLFRESAASVTQLEAVLGNVRRGEANAVEEAKAAVARMSQSCKDCHSAYRN